MDSNRTRRVTDESTCTPDSVPALCGGGRPSISACRCRQALAAYPQARAGSPRTPAQVRRLADGGPLGLAPGGVYRAAPVTRRAVGSYPTVSPLPGHAAGGLFSVALSRGSPRVAVNNHPALWSPDVPRRRPGKGRRRGRPVDSSVRLHASLARDGPFDAALLAAAGLAAGTVNAVAGGGSLITFPALIAIGLPPVAANVTNSRVGLPRATWPSVVRQPRPDLARQRRRHAAALLPTAVVGAVAGCALLLATPERAFDLVVPFLVLGADRGPGVPGPAAPAGRPPARLGSAGAGVTLHAMVALGSVYGGYFGAALGVMLVAALGAGAGRVDRPGQRVEERALRASVGLITVVRFAVVRAGQLGRRGGAGAGHPGRRVRGRAAGPPALRRGTQVDHRRLRHGDRPDPAVAARSVSTSRDTGGLRTGAAG